MLQNQSQQSLKSSLPAATQPPQKKASLALQSLLLNLPSELPIQEFIKAVPVDTVVAMIEADQSLSGILDSYFLKLRDSLNIIYSS